jgi:hypothetical protein
LAPRAYLAVTDQGMIWSDEVYQTLEQGHRLAFGYGLVPWEFKAGARSWLLPGMIGCGMRLLALLGVTSGGWMVVAVKLGFALLSALALVAMLRIAQYAAGTAGVLLLGLVGAALPASLLYGSRAMSEVASAPCLAWALALLWRFGLGPAGRASEPGSAGWWSGQTVVRLLGAGGLLGLAAVLRYQVVVLVPVVVLLVAWRGSFAGAVLLAAGAALLIGMGGLLDWLTWGKPFAAFLAYLRFNLLEHVADRWGVAGRGFYLSTLVTTSGPVWLLLALGFLLGLPRSWPVAVLAATYIAAHSAVAHKELRFIYPVLPLLLLCSAVGLAQVLDRLPTPRLRLAGAALLGCAMAGLLIAHARHLTFRDIGQPMDSQANGGPTSTSVWHAFDATNRLIARAGTFADLCGLAVPAANPYWTGGYTYFHRRAPLIWAGGRGDYDAANYVLLGPGQKMEDARYRRWMGCGSDELYRREGGCARPSRANLGYGRLSPSGIPGS